MMYQILTCDDFWRLLSTDPSRFIIEIPFLKLYLSDNRLSFMLSQNFLDVLFGIPLLLFLDIECVHALLPGGGFAGIMPIGARHVSLVTGPRAPDTKPPQFCEGE